MLKEVDDNGDGTVFLFKFILKNIKLFFNIYKISFKEFKEMMLKLVDCE